MFVCLNMHVQLPCRREISGKEKETTINPMEGGETGRNVSYQPRVCSVFVVIMLDEIAENF